LASSLRAGSVANHPQTRTRGHFTPRNAAALSSHKHLSERDNSLLVL